MNRPIGIGIAALATFTLATTTFAQATHDMGSGAPQAGWSIGHGGLRFTDGGNSSLMVRNFMQVNFSHNETETSSSIRNGFDIRRARTIINGTVFDPRLRYWLANDWTDSTSVKDAWLSWEVYSHEDYNMTLRAGQQKATFGREFQLSGGKLDFIDRGLVTRAFSGSRSRGAQLQGNALNGSLHWNVGVFNNDTAGASSAAGEDSSNPDNELDYTVSVQYSCNPQNTGQLQTSGADLANTEHLCFSVGAGAWWGNEGGGLTPDVEVFMLNFFGEVRMQGFAANAEFFNRNEELDTAGGPDADSTGYQIGASWTQPATGDQTHRWGFGARIAMVENGDPTIAFTGTSLGALEGEILDIELVANLFHSGDHRLKHQAGIIFRNTDFDLAGAKDTDDVIFTVQSTLWF